MKKSFVIAGIVSMMSTLSFGAGDAVKVVFTPGENAFFKARIE